MKKIIVLLLSIVSQISYSQSVSILPNTGIQLPILDKNSIPGNSLSPGLLAFDYASNSPWFYNGGWNQITSSLWKKTPISFGMKRIETLTPNEQIFLGPDGYTHSGNWTWLKLFAGIHNNDGTAKGIGSSLQSVLTGIKGSANASLCYSQNLPDYGDSYNLISVQGTTFLDTQLKINGGKIIGGQFEAYADTIGVENAQVIGVHGLIAGQCTITGDPSNVLRAAILGEVKTNSIHNGWAGYFIGRSYLSDKVGVGTKNFPTNFSSASVLNLSNFSANQSNVDVSNYKLFVKGGILTEEITLKSGWADYVFEDQYVLKPLFEVEKFISQNKHLPNIPSAKAIEEQGLNVGNIAVLQQEKIEEVFLHLIALNKEVKELQQKNRELEKQIIERK